MSASEAPEAPEAPLKVLVIDIGGTGVKILATGETERRRFPSGRKLTPDKMVADVKKLAKGWRYDVVSIGYPGPVREGAPALEPRNLARGWLGFDFQAGRLDTTVHPFSSGIGPGDCRLTTRYHPRELNQGLFGILCTIQIDGGYQHRTG